ncbi:hypothetical protein EVAR_14545_1 [Eumeta japonica]|uniref:THAP-type domain-containing protein n=1 Tax=Eumeta variegata TaxID=151549 RepID=A0A4C1U3G4_EUMVA|nr:hypothetical protein EVAR_14545_1 [Eumeta japonica]
MPKKDYMKCYFGCRTKGPFHRFPKPDYPHSDRFDSWKAVLSPAIQNKGDSYICDNVRICDFHFEDRYRLPSKRLTRTGVPTLNIPIRSCVERTGYLLKPSTNQSNFGHFHKTGDAGPSGCVPSINLDDSQREQHLENTADGTAAAREVMSPPTALNPPPYEGVVERRAVPVELHNTTDGRPVARLGTCLPIHSTSAEEAARLALITHHYAGLFTENILSPLGELAYVRLDADTVEKVFVNRSRRILITSSDGRLAQWRAVPTFESRNRYVAGTPVVDGGGALVSVVLARRHNHYALAANDGEGGYFDTTEPWRVMDPPAGALVYADRWFTTREELRAYVSSLGPVDAGAPTPVLHRGARTRVSLVAPGGRQIAHVHLHTALTDDVEYL